MVSLLYNSEASRRKLCSLGGVNSLSLTLRAKPTATDRLRRTLRDHASLSLVLTVSVRLRHGAPTFWKKLRALAGGVYVINKSGAPLIPVSMSARLCSACANTEFICEKGRAPP